MRISVNFYFLFGIKTKVMIILHIKDCHNPIFYKSYSHHQLAESYLHINFRLVFCHAGFGRWNESSNIISFHTKETLSGEKACPRRHFVLVAGGERGTALRVWGLPIASLPSCDLEWHCTGPHHTGNWCQFMGNHSLCRRSPLGAETIQL